MVGWAAIATAAATAAVFSIYGAEEEGWRMLLRVTARISGLLFLAAFVASSLRRLWPNDATAWLLRNRRCLGVSVGLAHTVHGIAIAVFVRLTNLETGPAALAPGLLAYAVLAAMVATSFDSTAAALGRSAWRRLHGAGAYVLWGAFAIGFVGGAGAGDPISASYGVAYGIAMPLRLWGLRGRKR